MSDPQIEQYMVLNRRVPGCTVGSGTSWISILFVSLQITTAFMILKV
jgi:hypothetical protein